MSIHNGVMNAGHSLWNLLSKVRVISFNKAGYDPFIDFLKAYSIICVIITHAIPSKYWGYTMLMIWGDMQVPMFVLLQTFHAYKKGVKPSVNLQKLFRRIIHPFIWMQLFIFVCGVARCYLSDSLTIRQELEDTIVWGGKGPGSYFPWVYVQIAFLLPFVWRFFQKFTMAQLLLPFIVVCIAFDVLFSYINLPENIYSLLSVRYFFLIYLGMIWVKDGVRMNIKTFALSVVTIGLTLFFFYTNMNLEPFFFQLAG